MWTTGRSSAGRGRRSRPWWPPAPRGTSLPPPSLNYAQVTLARFQRQRPRHGQQHPERGQRLLANITLPADGTYHVQVQAPAGQPGVTGFYNLTVADATVHQMPLTVNKTSPGSLQDRYSTDQWTFSATANQQVQFNLVIAANPDIEFDLTGPGGYTAFSGATASSGQIDLPATGTYTLTVHTTGQPGGYAFEFDQASQIALTLNTPYQAPGRQRAVAALRRHGRGNQPAGDQRSPTRTAGPERDLRLVRQAADAQQLRLPLSPAARPPTRTSC